MGVNMKIRKFFDTSKNKEASQVTICPNCKCGFPVPKELIDYGELYKQQKEITKQQENLFNAIIDQMEEEMPEIKIFLHNKRVQAQRMLENLIQKFLGEDDGE